MTIRWTVETERNEYGWFESYAAALAFAHSVGGGTLHQYKNPRLTETKEITREEYENLVLRTTGRVLLDPSKYVPHG